MGTTQKSVTLTLTERAGEEVKKFLAEEKVAQELAGLRVAVLPGGCSGFRYSLNIEEHPAADDVVIESAGVRLFVDEFSSQYQLAVSQRHRDRLQEQLPGVRVRLRESERLRRLRLRIVVHGLSVAPFLCGSEGPRTSRALSILGV